MYCRNIEPMVLAERDGGLTPDQYAALERHVATCPACRQFRATLNAALDTFKTDTASVTVPEAEGEWRTVRGRLREERSRFAQRRKFAPLLWFGAPGAAAAAVVFAFFLGQPKPPQTDTVAHVAETASADYVEAGDANASTMVYVDKDSGWLVVWAVDGEAKSNG